MSGLVNFQNTIQQLTDTKDKRDALATRLGITPRQLLSWRSGDVPTVLARLVNIPDLAWALVCDAEAAQTNDKTPN